MTDARFVVYGLVETRPGHRFFGIIRYVGQTQDLVRRVRNYRAGQGNNRQMKFWLAECPDFGVQELATADSLEEAWVREIEHIALHETYSTTHGMNYRAGGTGGDMLSQESRDRISDSLRLAHANDPTLRERISKAMIALSSDPEWRERKRHEMLEWSADPANRAMISEKTREAMARPDVRANLKAAQERRIRSYQATCRARNLKESDSV